MIILTKENVKRERKYINENTNVDMGISTKDSRWNS